MEQLAKIQLKTTVMASEDIPIENNVIKLILSQTLAHAQLKPSQ